MVVCLLTVLVKAATEPGCLLILWTRLFVRDVPRLML